jgi:hypothetical protein
MRELPIVYWQVKKIKEIWLRKEHPQREEMVKMFDETLREIEEEYIQEDV